MGFIIQIRYIDWEGYPIGSAHSLVGPFDSKDAALQWMDNNPAFVEENQLWKTKYGYSCGAGRELIIVDPLAYVPTPEDWTPRS